MAQTADLSFPDGFRKDPVKSKPPERSQNHAGGSKWAWLPFLLLARGGGLGGLGLGHALLELVDAPGSIDEFLLPGVERMAGVANTHDNDRLRGAGLNHVAARATNFRIHILRMNRIFHKRPEKLASALRKTRQNWGCFGVSFSIRNGGLRLKARLRPRARARSLLIVILIIIIILLSTSDLPRKQALLSLPSFLLSTYYVMSDVT